MRRFVVALLVLTTTFAALAALPTPSPAQTTVSFTVTVIDETANTAIGGAAVALLSTSGGSPISGTTDGQGKATFSVTPDTYDVTVRASGYVEASLHDQVITESRGISTVVRLRRLARDGHVPALVHSSLLAAYNRARPEHVGREPFYGRYTYVLLFGGTEAQPRNLALLQAFVAKYAPTGTTIPVGAPTGIDNPFGYNIFFVPVIDRSAGIRSGPSAAQQLLNEYDYDAARNIRDRYCAVPAHTTSSICAQPYGDGPVLLTFVRPLPPPAARFPPAFAYDLTAVLPAQFPQVRDTVSKTIAVPEPILADTTLPPTFLMKYVAPLLATIASALDDLVPQLKMFADAGLKP